MCMCVYVCVYMYVNLPDMSQLYICICVYDIVYILYVSMR